ncbi:integrating conjugative element protein [Pseudomonas sp. KK18]|uniref:integrating conjugative element protein n=1 Tax=Pseudomonas sp. KK18 TaxID=3123039 RepID=UPI0030CD8F09
MIGHDLNRLLLSLAIAALCAAPAAAQDNTGKLNPVSPSIIHTDMSLPSGLQWILPVRSPKLSPGRVDARTLHMLGLKPFFLVGEDATSLEWLSSNATRLTELGAAGLVVDVTDAGSLRRIQSLVPELTVMPVSGDDIAERLQLSHYPVLITATALEQ